MSREAFPSPKHKANAGCQTISVSALDTFLLFRQHLGPQSPCVATYTFTFSLNNAAFPWDLSLPQTLHHHHPTV